MLAVNFFGFGTGEGNSEIQTETVSVVNPEEASNKLISSGSGEILLFGALFASILFAYFSKKFA